MRRNPFLEGAVVATTCLIITKLLGIIYVIPFYAIIGAQGGALYGYAYSIYSIFLNLSSIGLPLAMSKITSEYNALGYYDLKKRTYKIGKQLIFGLSVISFFILMIGAPFLAHTFIGDIQGGNTLADVTFVIRLIATAILIVPVLSITRGYFQGHRFITPSSLSQIIEQIIRVIIIVVGSYLCIKVFNLPLRIAVGVAILAATIGAFFAFVYLQCKLAKNKELLDQEGVTKQVKEVSNKAILVKLLYYSVPFVFTSLILSFYNFVDLTTMVKVMVNQLKYAVSEAEITLSIILTWGSKLNMIVMAIATGLTTSIIPNITRSYMRNDLPDFRQKVNRSLQLLFFTALPMTVGLSLLAEPVWTVFYGHSEVGTIVFRYSILVALIGSLSVVLNVILNSLNKYKKLFLYTIAGFLVKAFFTVPLMHSFHALGLHASYGAVTATIFGYATSIILILSYLYKTYQVQYEETFNRIINMLFVVIIMALIILVFQLVIPVSTPNRVLAFILVIFYSILGALIYIVLMIKNKLLMQVFGVAFLNKILVKLKLENLIKLER